MDLRFSCSTVYCQKRKENISRRDGQRVGEADGKEHAVMSLSQSYSYYYLLDKNY